MSNGNSGNTYNLKALTIMRKTLKFGGKSLGSAEAMKQVAKIVHSEQAQLTVLSSMTGTNDALKAIINDDLSKIKILENKYRKCIDELLTDRQQEGITALNECFDIIRTSKNPFKILAQGEILTSRIFTLYAKECGMNAQLLYAPDFIHIDSAGNVQVDNLMLSDDAYYFTQGFICSDEDGNIYNLGELGSDYTVSCLASVIKSSEVQIWSMDKVMHTSDPKLLKNTKPIVRMSFSQAAELAYFGAKILHPLTIQPCKINNVDVVLRNTLEPEFAGTRITNDENDIKFLAVAHKENVTLIRVAADRMLNAYGFLSDVLAVFERNETVIDMVTTSEVAVAITLSDLHVLDTVMEELKELGALEVEHSNSVICIVGNMNYSNEGIAAVVFEAISEIPVKMISYGASQRSLSLLVDSKYTQEMLENINTLF